MIIKIENKASRYPLSKFKHGYGYFYRARSFNTLGIVLHTTNGNKNSTYQNELNYLLKAPKVSAHFLIGKEGQVTQLLGLEYAAWHAGYVNDRQYDNNNSIGIELHYTPGENKNLPKMMQATLELCKYLRSTQNIIGMKRHREIAIYSEGPLKGQIGRKSDPSNLTDEEFEVFRNRVFSDIRVVKKGTVIYTDTGLTHRAAHIQTDTIRFGVLLEDIELDVSRLTSKVGWLTNGYGFIQL